MRGSGHRAVLAVIVCKEEVHGLRLGGGGGGRPDLGPARGRVQVYRLIAG